MSAGARAAAVRGGWEYEPLTVRFKIEQVDPNCRYEGNSFHDTVKLQAVDSWEDLFSESHTSKQPDPDHPELFAAYHWSMNVLARVGMLVQEEIRFWDRAPSCYPGLVCCKIARLNPRWFQDDLPELGLACPEGRFPPRLSVLVPRGRGKDVEKLLGKALAATVPFVPGGPETWD